MPAMRRLFFIMFGLVLLIMLASAIWNIMVFRDCLAHGHAMYQCQAAMQNPNYVAIDRMN